MTSLALISNVFETVLDMNYIFRRHEKTKYIIVSEYPVQRLIT